MTTVFSSKMTAIFLSDMTPVFLSMMTANFLYRGFLDPRVSSRSNTFLLKFLQQKASCVRFVKLIIIRVKCKPRPNKHSSKNFKSSQYLFQSLDCGKYPCQLFLINSCKLPYFLTSYMVQNKKCFLINMMIFVEY